VCNGFPEANSAGTEILTSEDDIHKYTLAFVFALLIALPAGASDMTDVMSVVHRWVEGFSSADANSAIATRADQAAIIDDFSPHEWHGDLSSK
jgi:hypothetical protein